MSTIGQGYAVRQYVRNDGRCPFREWISALATPVRARISARVDRFQAGNLGDAKSVGGGVHEARLMFGPGYRVYFGIHRRQVVLLLCGGDKATQHRDIEKAKTYWQDYLEVEGHEQT